MLELLDQGATAVAGDLSDLDQTRGVADQLNRLGRMDAVIHNAGVYTGQQIIPVNVVAPYVLTALIDRPHRLIYLSTSDHFRRTSRVERADWSGRGAGAYPDSKLLATVLAAAVAWLWTDLVSNAVDPGWGADDNRRARRARRE